MILVTLAYMFGWTYYDTGHIGIHVWVDVCMYVRTINDVLAKKPKFLASMGYHIFLIMVLHAPLACADGAPL